MTKKALAESAAYFKSFFEYNRGQARGAVVVLEFIGSDRVVEVPRSVGEYFLDFNQNCFRAKNVAGAQNGKEEPMSKSASVATQGLIATCQPISENETVAAFETTDDGFVAVFDGVVGTILDGALDDEFLGHLPQGVELALRQLDGFCTLEARGIGGLAALERAALAETLVDEVLTHLKGGAR